MEENQISIQAKTDLLLEQINTDVRLGDDWNEIQEALRDLGERENKDTVLKLIYPKIEAFMKKHKIKNKYA